MQQAVKILLFMGKKGNRKVTPNPPGSNMLIGEVDIVGSRSAIISPTPTNTWIDPIKKNKHCRYRICCDKNVPLVVDIGQGNVITIVFG